MRRVSPSISFVTGAIVRSSSSPSDSSTTGVSTLGARPAVPLGKLSLSMGSRSFECGGGGDRSTLGDPLRDELGVVFHPADERGAARVLPGKAEEVEAGNVGDPPAVDQLAVAICDRKVDPGVVEPVTGRPDGRGDIEGRAVLEDHRSPGSAYGAPVHGHSGAFGRARAGADECVPRAQPAAELRVDALLEDAELAEPPEEVSPADPLRKRHLARSDREVGLAIGCELRGDLEAGVAAAHDEHGALGELSGVAVAHAVGLEDGRVEVGCECGNARNLERPGCDDDLVGDNGCAVLKVEPEAAVLPLDGADLGAELHGEVVGLRVALEIGD